MSETRPKTSFGLLAWIDIFPRKDSPHYPLLGPQIKMGSALNFVTNAMLFKI